MPHRTHHLCLGKQFQQLRRELCVGCITHRHPTLCEHLPQQPHHDGLVCGAAVGRMGEESHGLAEGKFGAGQHVLGAGVVDGALEDEREGGGEGGGSGTGEAGADYVEVSSWEGFGGGGAHNGV